MGDQEEVQEILGRDYFLNEFDELDGEILNKRLEGNDIPNYVP